MKRQSHFILGDIKRERKLYSIEDVRSANIMHINYCKEHAVHSARTLHFKYSYTAKEINRAWKEGNK